MPARPACLLGILLLTTGCASAPSARPEESPRRQAPSSGTPALERVVFPAGQCPTGWLEVQVFDRAGAKWRGHTGNGRIRAGSCLRIDPGQLLNEVRVRCIDPADERTPSEWVLGFDMPETGAPDPCPAATP